MAAKSKDTFYEDSRSTVTGHPSAVRLPRQQQYLKWDAQPEILWGTIDLASEPVISGSSRTSAGVMALSGEYVARRGRSENESLSHGDDSDLEVNGLSGGLHYTPEHHLKSKSVPVDLVLQGSSENEDNMPVLMRNGSASPKPQETLSSTPRRDLTIGGASSGRQSPLGRSQTMNGRQSPSNGRPHTLPGTPKNTGDKFLNSSQNKKRSNNWFSLSYKQKSDEFHKLFKDIPADERLLVDYSCAMQKDLLVHGRLYISQNWICFYANILFKWETAIAIPCKDIKSITKEKTARVIPNAIQINTLHDKYFFSSFASRDKSYLMMFRVWQNVLLAHPMSNQQLWQWVHQLYGSQLGLTASDDDYEPPDSNQESDNAITPDMSVAGIEDTVGSNFFPVSPLTMAANRVVPGDAVDSLEDAAAPGDLSDDYTDTSEDSLMVEYRVTPSTDDEVEAECPDGHEHNNWVNMDVVLNFSVDQVFNMLFSDTDTEFYKAFLHSINTTDVVLGQWPEEVDEEGEKTRTNTFTIAINASFGPKSTSSCETQHIRKESKPGSYYCVDCESLNDPSLPYGESFFVWNRYCITRLTKQTCRVQVHSKICYKKSVFALAKAIIEKNVRNGVHDHFRPLNTLLTQESDKVVICSTERPRKKKRYTRHRAVSTSRTSQRPSNGAISTTKSITASHPTSEMESSRRNSYITSTVRVMSALLIFLVMFNMLLFFKLWSLETRHVALQFDKDSSEMYSHQDLLDLLNKQRNLYEKDIKHWQGALESSTNMIQELQHSIDEIKQNQNMYSAKDKLPASANVVLPDKKPPISSHDKFDL